MYLAQGYPVKVCESRASTTLATVIATLKSLQIRVCPYPSVSDVKVSGRMYALDCDCRICSREVYHQFRACGRRKTHFGFRHETVDGKFVLYLCIRKCIHDLGDRGSRRWKAFRFWPPGITRLGAEQEFHWVCQIEDQSLREQVSSSESNRCVKENTS